MMHIGNHEKELKKINEKIDFVSVKKIPELFSKIPIEVFGALPMEPLEHYAKIRNYLPLMPPDEVQNHWTGSAGRVLLHAGLIFFKKVLAFIDSQQLEMKNLNILDFGCGWGRFMRLLLKYVPEDQIFGVDPWDESLGQCRLTRVRGNLEQTDWLCRSLPFGSIKFDVVIAYSVFTHLSEKTARIALHTIRSRVSDRSFLIVTIRPFEFWEAYKKENPEASVSSLQKRHRDQGFAFQPLPDGVAVEGEITYGDTTISLEYVKEQWKEWELIDTSRSADDPNQIVVFLRPRW